MDSKCDYLVYNADTLGDMCQNYIPQPVPHLHCSDYPIQEKPIPCTVQCETPRIPLNQALAGRMVPYLEVYESSANLTSVKLNTPMHYVKHGAIHMRDIPPDGTWLCEKAECAKATRRLRLTASCVLHLSHGVCRG